MKNCSVFASLISPSKMILFEKKYQTFDTVFYHQMKHLEVRDRAEGGAGGALAPPLFCKNKNKFNKKII